MKYLLGLFVTILFCLPATSQQVIISGQEGNRPLRWSDFTGKPDQSSTHSAQCYWNIRWQHAGVEKKDGKTIVKDFKAILELDPKRSWRKKGKETDELLLHEQGHFNNGLLCQRELLERVKNGQFSLSNANAEIQQLANEMLKKYQQQDDAYDRESDHSKNKEGQQKWNLFFEEALRSE